MLGEIRADGGNDALFVEVDVDGCVGYEVDLARFLGAEAVGKGVKRADYRGVGG